MKYAIATVTQAEIASDVKQFNDVFYRLYMEDEKISRILPIIRDMRKSISTPLHILQIENDQIIKVSE